MNTGIYVRVSTEEQAKEGYSIRAQQEKLMSYAKVMEWEVYKIYADEGISGKNIVDRPAINELINDIRSKKIKNVLVFKVDRLTRSMRDLVELIEIFAEYECAFNSLMESIDTNSASGRMFLKIIGIFAEFERENIIERTRLGCEKKAREGYSVCKKHASYGYKRAIGSKIQEIDENEVETVHEIFDMYVNQHKTFHAIACELNVRKIPTKNGSIWHAKTIKRLITNPNYIGKIRYSIEDESRYFEVEGKHEAIISKELYEEAQNKIAKIEKKTTTKRPNEQSYFGGTLECAICGGKITSHGKSKTRKDGGKTFIGYYICVNKMVNACESKGMGHKKVEKAFVEYISNIENMTVIDEVDIRSEERENDNSVLIAEYKENIGRLERKEKEIMQLYIGNTLCYDEYTSMMKLIKNEKNSYVKGLEETENQEDDGIIELQREDIILNIKDNWNMLTNKERLQFLHTYVERVVILNQAQEGSVEGKIKIERVDFYEK